MLQSAYSVQLYLALVKGPVWTNLLKVTLQDASYHGRQESNHVRLSLEGRPPDADFSHAVFLANFLNGDDLGKKAGLAFGRYLFDLLLSSGAVGALWADIWLRRRDQRLRMEVILPRDADQRRLTLPDGPAGKQETYDLADLPFELLADKQGFLLWRGKHSLVRTLDGISRDTDACTIAGDASVLAAWSNPKSTWKVPKPGHLSIADLLPLYEESLSAAVKQMDLPPLVVCREASRNTLQSALATTRPTFFSLVAHGSSDGGLITLHKDRGIEFLTANELAIMVQEAGVRVALIWSCYGGRRSGGNGSVLAQLLDPEGGKLSAVVGSHAALNMENVPDLAGRFLESLKDTTKGDLEGAVAAARHRLGEDNLQWAALVYYARTGPSVRVEIPASVDAEMRTSTESLLDEAGNCTPYFLGREEDLRLGQANLRQYRAISLIGAPGIGKSELARALAQYAIRDGKFDKVRWLSLVKPVSIEELRRNIASAFLPEDVALGIKSNEELGRALGSLKALIVLDNAEDVLETPEGKHVFPNREFQDLIEDLLTHTWNLRVLLTTREQLGPFGSVHEECQPVSPLADAAALELFDKRTSSLLATSAAQSPSAQRLVKALDGHPLSLVLVASLVAYYDIEDLTCRLLQDADIEPIRQPGIAGQRDEEHALLRRTAHRQISLAACMNMSYQPLSKRNQTATEMFLWIAHLPSGLPRQLLSEIFGKTAMDDLAELQRLNLASGDGLRVRLLTPLRLYAIKQSDRDLTAQRRIELTNQTITALGKWMETQYLLLGTQQAYKAYQEAKFETENIGELLRRNPNAPSDELAQQVARLIVPWANIMMRLGMHSTAIEYVKAASKTTCLNQRGQAATQEILGKLYAQNNQFEEARAEYESALKNFCELKKEVGEARVRAALGRVYARIKRFEEAKKQYELALSLFSGQPGQDGRLGAAGTHRQLGDWYLRSHQNDQAEAEYRLALELFSARPQELLGYGTTLRALGILCEKTGRYSEAQKYYSENQAICEQIHDRQGQARMLRAMGSLYERVPGRAQEEVEAPYRTALEIFGEIHDRQGEANIHQDLGNYYRKYGLLNEAQEQLQLGLEIYQEIRAEQGEANTYQALGELYLARKQWDEAKKNFARAMSIYQGRDNLLEQANTFQALGKLEQALGTEAGLANAYEYYRQSLRLHGQVNNRPGMIETYWCMGEILVAEQPARAAVLFGRALESLRDREDYCLQKELASALASALDAVQDSDGFAAASRLALSTDINGKFAMDESSKPLTSSAEAWTQVLQSVGVCTEKLQGYGIDPEGPLQQPASATAP